MVVYQATTTYDIFHQPSLLMTVYNHVDTHLILSELFNTFFNINAKVCSTKVIHTPHRASTISCYQLYKVSLTSDTI